MLCSMSLSKAVFLPLSILACYMACRSEEPQPQATVRLVTLQKASSSATPAHAVAIPKTEFRFDQGLQGWESFDGISGLTVRNGRLVGRSTNENPILHLARKTSKEDLDTLHSVEVKVRVSAGANFRIGFVASEKLDPEEAKENVRDFLSVTERTPVIAGTEMRTYTLKPRFAYFSSSIRHLVVAAVDQAGADFEIESIRLIFRKEYLATIPTGVSWQGLKGIYHESIVSRSPEAIRFGLTLPKNPWLDLNIGTIEDGPVKFRVSIQEKSKKEEVVFERTITRPHVWQPVTLDLANGGKKVTLSLSVSTEKNGMIGFWGSPAIRDRVAKNQDSAKLPPQGVIIIWTDTLRPDHLEAYGYDRKTAPNVKRIASEGVLFNRCVSQATWTKVASPTLFTGLYPTAHGVLDFPDRLPNAAETMAEVFQKAGYATIGFSSNLFTGTYSNFHQGFDQLHEGDSLADPNSSKTTREYMDRLLPWLDDHRQAPFFIFLHAYDAHDPYEPYPPYNTLWADASMKSAHEKQLEDARKVIKSPLMKLFGMPNRSEMLEAKINPEEFVKYAKGWYDGSIRAMDTEIGRLLEFLQNNNLAQNTLLVFVGDHGEEFLEHERMFHGQHVYGELTSVPLIFWAPGRLRGGLTVKDTVETVDVMPTILELAGIKAPQNMQGQSLTELFSKQASGKTAEANSILGVWKRPAFSMKAATVGNDSPPPQETESFAVVLNEWKLIHNTKRKGDTPEFELYNQTSDSINKTNVAKQNPEAVKRLSRLIEEWREKSSANRLKPDAEAAQSLSQEELERLRALGYIQ